MTDAEIERALKTQLAVPQSIARRAVAAGRHRFNEAVKAGKVPVTPAGTVPTSWLRQVLQIDDSERA